MRMSAVLVELVTELRRSGLSVSVAETQDALAAISEIGLEDRRAFRSALRTTLVKEPGSLDEFDRLFEIYFPPPRAMAPAAAHEGGVAPPDIEDRLERALREKDDQTLREIASELVEEHADVEPTARVSEEHYRYRALRGLDLEDMIRRVVQEDISGKGLSALDRRLVEEDFEERMKRFSDEVSQEVRRRRRLGVDLQAQSERDRRPPPEQVDFLWAKGSDLAAMRAALYPLSRRLALRLSNKRRTARRGRLDLRRTIRSSLSYGGAPVEPRWRRPISGRPELWVLCDISGSMRNFARFTLELVYALVTQFERVRSFVFIDALDEVTDKLERSDDLTHALDRIDAEADVVAVDGQSWYGNSLAQFWRDYGRELSPRATVLILGDARNNFRTTGTDVLAEVGRNARRVWWLNPEPASYWGSADSVADEFARHTDGMFECRNLAQLESFVSHAL